MKRGEHGLCKHGVVGGPQGVVGVGFVYGCGICAKCLQGGCKQGGKGF